MLPRSNCGDGMARSRIAKGCLGLVLTLLAVTGVALAIALWQGKRVPSGTPDYVALGSSFAAGAGLGALQDDSPLLCARSKNGYPQQLARLRGLRIVDMSCGGAVTRHLLQGGQFFQGPQIRAITGTTRLVTITVGGNDIGYIGDLSMLAMRNSHGPLGWLMRAFWNGPTLPASGDYARLQNELVATLQAIHRQAPQARVVVATYPAILPPAGTCPTLGLDVAEVDAMRAVAEQLAVATTSAAKLGGAILVDMNTLGASHHACSPDPWIRGWTNGGVAPFHPTLPGAKATAEAIAGRPQTE
jgi:lysophospholipase L1-like esterase